MYGCQVTDLYVIRGVLFLLLKVHKNPNVWDGILMLRIAC